MAGDTKKGSLTTGSARVRAMMEAKTGKKFVPGKIGKGGVRRAGKVGNGLAVIALDCSYSMQGKCFSEAKKGAKAFIDTALSKGYQVGLVGFGSTAWPQAEMGGDAEALKMAVDSIAISGTTDMTGGINTACEVMSREAASGGTIFIVTDGMPDDQGTATAAAEAAKAKGFEIMCQGTEAADHVYLQSLASSDELAQMTDPADLKRSMERFASRHLALTHEKTRPLPGMRSKSVKK